MSNAEARFRNPYGMVEWVGQKGDPLPQTDPLGALAGGGQEDFRRGRVRVFGEEVVFYCPHIVEPQPIRQFHLFQRVVIDIPLAVLAPGLLNL